MLQCSKYGNSTCNPQENGREITIGILTTQKISVSFFSNLLSTSQKTVQSNGLINDSCWHHIVVTYDGSIDTNNGLDRVQIFIDNIQQSTSFFLLCEYSWIFETYNQKNRIVIS